MLVSIRGVNLIPKVGSSSFLSILLHFPLEVCPLIAATRSGGALKLPQRVWAEPGAKSVLPHFRHKFEPV